MVGGLGAGAAALSFRRVRDGIVVPWDPVAIPDADYFGRTVSMASRIAAAASAGQTLVTGLVAELARDSDLSFRQIGPVELKGFSERIPVYEAMPSA